MPSVVGRMTKGAEFASIVDAGDSGTDTASFNNNLSGADDTVQKALDTLDNMSGGGVDTSGAPVANDIARFTDADTLEGRSYAELKADLNLEIGTDVLAEQTIGIADDNLVEMDDADAADNDYAKFTANGLEGRSYAEVRGDLNVEDGADVTDATNVAAAGAVMHSLADAANDFLVASGDNTIVKKTLAETGAILEGDINHDNLQGFEANEHFTEASIDHSAVTNLDWPSAGHTFADSEKLQMGTGDDFEMYVNSDDAIFRNVTQDKDMVFYINDGGVDTEIMRLNADRRIVEVPGVICASAASLIIPANMKGVFLKYNSASSYGSLWSYDYGGVGYCGLEIDCSFLEFQISGTKKVEITTGGVIDTTDANNEHRFARGQIGVSGDARATFGYRGHGASSYAIAQTSAFATYVTSAAGQGVFFYPAATLALTLDSSQNATFTGTVSANLFGTIDTADGNVSHKFGRCQLGLNADYATFGYRGHGSTNFAVYQSSAWATTIKAGSGQAITFYPNAATLALTLSSAGLAVIPNVDINGGTINGITDLAVADGGTGASSAGDARTNLGLGTMAVEAAADYLALAGGTMVGELVTDGNISSSGAAIDFSSKNLTGIGTIASAGKNTITSTGQQLELEYDGSEQCDFTVDSSGDLTIAPSGTNLRITGTIQTTMKIRSNAKFNVDGTDGIDTTFLDGAKTPNTVTVIGGIITSIA